MPDPHPVTGHEHPDYVEPVNLARSPMAVDPGASRPDKLMPLLPVHGFHRIPEFRPHPRLHLNERDQLVPLGNEVDIAMA